MRLLISILVLYVVQQAMANHYQPLHCKKWKGDCEKYENHCSNVKQSHLLKSCCEPAQQDTQANFPSGRYTLKSGTFSTSDAWCDMETDADGGGWLMVMRRQSEHTTFDRLYHEYEDGFGDLEDDFWYGLRSMEVLTSHQPYEMRLDMFTDVNDTVSSASAHYGSFQVQGSNYTLSVRNFTGSDPNLMDNLMQFNNQQFVARRTKLDTSSTCSNIYRVGWWYSEFCVVSSSTQTQGTILTRPYYQLNWYDINLHTSPQARIFEKYEMKIRPKNCREVNSTT